VPQACPFLFGFRVPSQGPFDAAYQQCSCLNLCATMVKLKMSRTLRSIRAEHSGHLSTQVFRVNAIFRRFALLLFATPVDQKPADSRSFASEAAVESHC
jgi:hypothetical protein